MQGTEVDSLADIRFLLAFPAQRPMVAKVYFLEDSRVVHVDPVHGLLLNDMLPRSDNNQIELRFQPLQAGSCSCTKKPSDVSLMLERNS